MGWWIAIAVVVLLAAWLFLTYNGLIAARNRTQEAWSEIEVELNFSRRFYNGNVRDYNTKLQTPPTSLIAGALGFKAFGFFQADEGDRAVPQVSFNNMPASGPTGSLPPAAGPGGPPAPGSAGPPPQS